MAAIRDTGSIRIIEGSRLRIGVNTDGTVFQDLVGASAVNLPIGSRSKQTVDTFDGTASITGTKAIESSTVDLAGVLPHMKVMHDLRRADEQRKSVLVRFDFYGEQIRTFTQQATYNVSIAAPAADAKAKGGVITFGGTNPGTAELKALFENQIVLRGDLMFVGTVNFDTSTPYIINRYEKDDVSGKYFNVYVTEDLGADATAILPANKDVPTFWKPGIRLDFAADIEQLGSIAADANNPALSSGVVFAPNNNVGWADLLLGTEANAGW